jgi:hypothetical protein
MAASASLRQRKPARVLRRRSSVSMSVPPHLGQAGLGLRSIQKRFPHAWQRCALAFPTSMMYSQLPGSPRLRMWPRMGLTPFSYMTHARQVSRGEHRSQGATREASSAHRKHGISGAEAPSRCRRSGQFQAAVGRRGWPLQPDPAPRMIGADVLAVQMLSDVRFGAGWGLCPASTSFASGTPSRRDAWPRSS